MSVSYRLFDIEGVTTADNFVKKRLFPYFLDKVASYLDQHASDASVKETLAGIRDIFRETGRSDQADEDILVLLQTLSNEDCKDPRYKKLQGHVWAQGYMSRELKGHLYEDAHKQLIAWHDSGIPMATFSSDSVKAQQVLFEFSDFGDVRYLFTHHFDPNMGVKRVDGSYHDIPDKIGSKRQLESYQKIATILGHQLDQVEFFSDTPEELDAAKAAGMYVILIDRDGKYPRSVYPTHKDFGSPVVFNF